MQLDLSTKITRSFLLFACLLGGTLATKAQTTLVAGDVVIIGYNATENTVNTVSADDNFDFLLLKDITSGTIINFTDLGWVGPAFQGNVNNGCASLAGGVSDGCLQWTTGSALSAGTQVRIDNKSLTASSGTVSLKLAREGAAWGMDLSTSTDQIFAFQSSNTGTPLAGTITLIAAFQYGSGTWAGGVTTCASGSSSQSNDPTASVTYALALSLTTDNNFYQGISSGTATSIRDAAILQGNWNAGGGTAYTFPTATTYAVGIQWQGTTNNWSTTSNWSCTCTPSGSDDVIIPNGATAYPTISSGTVSVRNITIGSAASVTVSGSGVLQIAGTVSNSGTFTASAGGISFNGSTAQAIPGSSFTGSTIEDLVINNSAGVSISSSLNIAATGSLTVSSGTLTTGGNLTLLSTASGTARVANSAGTISGNVTVQRYIPGGRRAYRFLGHPLTTSQNLTVLTDDIDITGAGGATNGFTTTTTNGYSAFWYNPATANGSTSNDPGWTPYTTANGGSTANTWDKGEGLLVLCRGAIGEGLNGSAYTPSAVTLDMTGAINQGSQIINVTKGSSTTYGFVGNPFPSQVNMSAVTRGGGISSFYYTWDAGDGTKGAYTARLYSSGEILPSGGAFIADLTSSSTITFPESCKSASAPMALFNKTTSVNDHLLFEIYSNNDSLHWDRAELFFDNNAVNDLDANDAPKFVNPEVNFYTFSNDSKHLAIDSRPYKNGEIIPMAINSAPQATYAMKAEDFNMATGNNVFLHDKYLNKVSAVTPGFVYSFDVTSDPLSQGNRFALEMSHATSVEPIKTVSSLKVEISPNPVHDVATIKYTSPVNGKADIRVINMQGAVCRRLSSDIHATGNIQVPMSNLPNGVYMVELTCGGQTVTQKLIKE